MLSRAGRASLIAIAAGVLLALLFDALTHTEIGAPYLLIALAAVGIAWTVDYWLERGKRKEGKK